MNRGQDSTGLKDVPPPYHGVNYLDRPLQLNWQSQTSHRGYSVKAGLGRSPHPESDRAPSTRKAGPLHLAMLPGSSGPGCQAEAVSHSASALPKPGAAATHRQCTTVRPSRSACHSAHRAAGAGRPSWSQACPGRRTSAGTGSVAPQQVPSCIWAEQAAPGTWSIRVPRPPGDLATGSLKAAQSSPSWSSRPTHPRDVLHPENSGYQVLVRCARHELHLHEAILLPAWLRPVLQVGWLCGTEAS